MSPDTRAAPLARDAAAHSQVAARVTDMSSVAGAPGSGEHATPRPPWPYPTEQYDAPQADTGAQLGRIETILDRILRSLEPLAGSR